MDKITLKEMLEEIIDCILNKKEFSTYYWEDDQENFHRITQVDLLDDIRDDYNNSTEFEWQLKDSTLYRKK